MSAKKINTRIQQKHDTAANWETAGNNGFIPLAGEIIVYDGDDESAPKFKVGDGVLQADGRTVSGTNINDLPFVTVTPADLENYAKLTDLDDYAAKDVLKEYVTTSALDVVLETALNGNTLGASIPACSTTDNGEFLRVVNGRPAWVSVTSAESSAF